MYVCMEWRRNVMVGGGGPMYCDNQLFLVYDETKGETFFRRLEEFSSDSHPSGILTIF